MHIREFTEAHAKAVCQWKYANEYAVYNYPDWDTMLQQNWDMTDEQKRNAQFRAVVDEQASFTGIFPHGHQPKRQSRNRPGDASPPLRKRRGQSILS